MIINNIELELNKMTNEVDITINDTSNILDDIENIITDIINDDKECTYLYIRLKNKTYELMQRSKGNILPKSNILLVDTYNDQDYYEFDKDIDTIIKAILTAIKDNIILNYDLKPLGLAISYKM